jgi:hypothetical protein
MTQNILYLPRNKNNRLNDNPCNHAPPNLLDIAKLATINSNNRCSFINYFINLFNLSETKNIKCNFIAFSVDNIMFAKDIIPPILLDCGTKKDGHSHLAMEKNRDTIRPVFASGEAYFTIKNNKLNLVKITNIAGSFRISSDEHAERIQNIFRKKFGSLKGVTYVNQSKIYIDNIMPSIDEKITILIE